MIVVLPWKKEKNFLKYSQMCNTTNKYPKIILY